MTKDITAAITSLVYKLAVQCINFMRQSASFMIGIAACTVKQMFMVDRISLLQETACLYVCVCVFMCVFCIYVCVCVCVCVFSAVTEYWQLLYCFTS